jgi:ABC-2 type transport system permease protein
MIRITLRLQRVLVVVFVYMGLAVAFVQASTFASAAGRTPAQRLAFAHNMAPLGRQLAYMLPLPLRLDTLGGYLQWRALGIMPLFLGLFAVLSASAAGRGEEERGLLDCWLATGVARGRLMVARFGAFATAALGIVLATCAGAWLASWHAHLTLGVGPLSRETVVLTCGALACYGIALFLAQLVVTRRAAAGLAGVVLLSLLLLNGIARTNASLSSWRWLSPFHLVDLSQPLVPGHGLNVPAALGLLGIGLAFAALATLAFLRRDVGAPLFARAARPRPAERLPSANPLLRAPVLASLYEQRWGLLGWLLGTAVAALVFVSVTKTSLHLVQTTPSLRPYLTVGGGTNLEQALVGTFWFAVLQLELAAYAIIQVARWAADDAEGRLEMMLACPISRSRVVLERAAALALSLLLIAGVGAAVTAAAAAAIHISLTTAALANASWLVVVLALCFAALGAPLVGLAPRATIAILGGFAFVSYLLRELAPLLSWPSWVQHLSLFSLYGTPLGNGVYWDGAAAMAVIVVAGFGAGLLAMRRREVSR